MLKLKLKVYLFDKVNVLKSPYDDMKEKILARAKEGDRNAENCLYSELVNKFMTIACYRVRDKELARDIALEACQIVYSKYKTESISTSFEAWAHGILNTHIRHCLSKEVKRDALLTKYEFPVGDEINLESTDEFRIQLRYCFKRLLERNKRYARIINFTYQGFKSSDICKKLMISRTNYYVLLWRAREILWNCLTKGD